MKPSEHASDAAATPTSIATPRSRSLRRWVATLSIAALVAGCYASAVPRQGWNQRKWGPLVPHKSFPGDCSLCHVPESWNTIKRDFVFDHEKETGYALEGAHAAATCLRCHNDRGPVQQYVARGCAGCHTDPHEAQLGVDCLQCHDQASWLPTGMIAQHMRTRFPLVGVHLATACDQCHPGAHVGRFEGAPIACEECHQADLQKTPGTPVDHIALGYTHDCGRCHVPTSWQQAHFDHAFFPLTGEHRVIACAACHKNSVFAGTPRDCFSCHATDFGNAKNPDHAGKGYPTDCSMCHSTNAGWAPPTFDHETRFPILSGRHSFSCATCHASSVYSVFDCISCHTHDKAGTDSQHSGVRGYVYASVNCYGCHPRGSH